MLHLTASEIALIRHALRIALEDGSLFEGTKLSDAQVNRAIDTIRKKLSAPIDPLPDPPQAKEFLPLRRKNNRK